MHYLVRLAIFIICVSVMALAFKVAKAEPPSEVQQLFIGKKPISSGICTFVDKSQLPCMVYQYDGHYLIIGVQESDIVVVLEVWGTKDGKAKAQKTLWIDPRLTI